MDPRLREGGATRLRHPYAFMTRVGKIVDRINVSVRFKVERA
jgi:hypothetical protein